MSVVRQSTVGELHKINSTLGEENLVGKQRQPEKCKLKTKIITKILSYDETVHHCESFASRVSNDLD